MVVATCAGPAGIISVATVVALAEASFAAAGEQSCSYALSPLTVTVSGAGGSGQVTVSTGAGCSWTATTATAWLSVSPGQGIGSGTVTWVATPNTLRTQRFGSLIIGGRSVFVSQTQPTAASAAPGAPRELLASVSGSNVTLTGSPPDSGGEAPSSYVVEAGSSPSLANLASINTGSQATSFAANAPPGTYCVRVRAATSCGVTAPTPDVVVVVQP
jgi:hypothetical protein